MVKCFQRTKMGDLFMHNCHIYFYDGWLSVAPTVIGLAKTLAKHFKNVYIYMQKTQFKKYSFDEKNIYPIYFNNSLYWKREDKPFNFEKKVLKYIEKNKLVENNDFFVCIDESSMLPAKKLCEKFELNFAYLALELPRHDEYPIDYKEMFLKSKIVIVQDEPRLNKLLSSYGVNKDEFDKKVVYLPNDSLPLSSKSKKVDVVKQFKNNIPKDKCICANIGMISDAVYSYEIAKVFSNLDNAILLFHDRLKIKLKHKYIKSIADLKSPNIYFSKMLYDFDELELVYKPIDIGIACYSGMNNDHSVIGKSSGKLCFYLKYSKPVIVNRQEGLSDVIEKYNCGAVIDDVEDVSQWRNAINTIMSDYEGYKSRVEECYKQEFDFAEKIKLLEEFIEEINR